MAFRDQRVRLPRSGCFGAWFVFCAVLAVIVLGVVVWAVVKVVTHYT